MQFSKWHGIGNDFVIINGLQVKIDDYERSAIAMCNRNFGIGADGLITILPSTVADFKMQIHNSDGSEAKMCGNGSRCAARYVYENGMTDKKVITFETKAGLIKPELLFAGKEVSKVKVDMGEPRLTCQEIPVKSTRPDASIINQPLTLKGITYYITTVSMGNPHCVIFVEDLQTINLQEIGPLLENYPLFPDKTNVEFAQIKGTDKIEMIVWERGAGRTLACGTGACATLVAAVLNEKTERKAKLELEGGSLQIEWAADNHIYMTGPAVEVFRGNYLHENC